MPVTGGGGSTKKTGSSGHKSNNPSKTSKPSKSGKTNATLPGATYNLVQQPDFSDRISILSQPFYTGVSDIQRGHMAWDPNTTWPTPYGDTKANGKQTWARAPKVFFLYNPSVIAASYSATDGSIAASILYPTSTLNPILRVPLQQQVSFTIMFDRTYEMTSRGANSDVGKIGVEVDIAAMKQFTGMFTDVYGTTSGSTGGGLNGGSNAPSPFGGGSSGNTTSGSGPGTGNNINRSFSLTGINQGVMQITLSYVYFGEPDRGLRYYGYIDSWDVQYTHFNHHMIPMRAVVDVSFTLLPPPQTQGLPAGASATAATRLINGLSGTTFHAVTGQQP